MELGVIRNCRTRYHSYYLINCYVVSIRIHLLYDMFNRLRFDLFAPSEKNRRKKAGRKHRKISCCKRICHTKKNFKLRQSLFHQWPCNSSPRASLCDDCMGISFWLIDNSIKNKNESVQTTNPRDGTLIFRYFKAFIVQLWKFLSGKFL